LASVERVRSRVAFFRKMPLFAGLPEADLSRLCRIAREVTASEGTLLMEEGTPGDGLYVVLEGEVEVTKLEAGRELLLARRGRGEVLGEMSLLADTPRSATVRAACDSVLLVIPGPEFQELLQGSASASAAILRTVAGRLRSTEALLMEQEKLVSLGTLAGGLAHEINNPAAAIRRSADHLRTEFEDWELRSLELRSLRLTSAQESRLLELRATSRAPGVKAPGAVARGAAEEALGEWLRAIGVSDGWELAPALVEQGLDRDRLESEMRGFSPDQLTVVLRWLAGAQATRALLDRITRAADQIVRVVAATKSYAYLDQAPVQEVDLVESLESTLQVLAHRLEGNVIVERDYEPGAVRVEGFGRELNQVWTNLISNALDAMGGEGRLELKVRRGTGRAEVEIADNGPGIPPEIQPRVFDPFFTTKPPGVGSGLGLHIVHNVVVNRHHGSVEVESRPGRTVFRILLPVPPTGRVGVSEPPPSGSGTSSSEG